MNIKHISPLNNTINPQKPESTTSFTFPCQYLVVEDDFVVVQVGADNDPMGEQEQITKNYITIANILK